MLLQQPGRGARSLAGRGNEAAPAPRRRGKPQHEEGAGPQPAAAAANGGGSSEVVVLVPDKAVKAAVRGALGDEVLVLTALESKGLEFKVGWLARRSPRPCTPWRLAGQHPD